jgi:ATP-dependent Clp protease ATP-binding subunit ClpA
MFERFTAQARMALVVGQEEARTLEHDRIGPEHLLIALLGPSGTDFDTLVATAGLTQAEARTIVGQRHRRDELGESDAEALRAIGIDLDVVRESLEATFGPDAWTRAGNPAHRARPAKRFGTIPLNRDAKKAIEGSLREAVARKDDRISAEHLMLGVLRSPNDTVRAVVESHLSVEELRRRLLARLDSAA